MGITTNADWAAMFGHDVAFLEIIIRGSVMYLSLFLLLRVVLRRESGTMGLTDLLLMVLVADAAQNGMAADYKSVPDGILLVATLVFWNFFLDFLAYRFPLMARRISPPPLCLIKDGVMQSRNMRKEMITKEDLLEQLREQGLEDASKVKRAYVEGDGKFSVIKKNDDGDCSNTKAQVL